MEKIIIIIVAIVLTIAIILSIVIHLDNKYNLRHFFDDWESEMAASYIQVMGGRHCYDKNSNSMFEMNRDAEVVFCVRNDRIYFGYSTRDPEISEVQYNLWHIASVNTEGEDFREHYKSNLSCGVLDSIDFDDMSVYPKEYEPDYTYKGFGGLYDEDGHIYLHGKTKTICYDIDEDETTEVEKLPEQRYSWSITSDNRSVTISDGNISRTITLESIAENNSYAKRLLSLSDYKTNTGGSFLEFCFDHIKVCGEHIYIINRILNWNGESRAIVFDYDFDTEQVVYVMNYFTCDNVSGHYQFAVAEELLDVG